MLVYCPRNYANRNKRNSTENAYPSWDIGNEMHIYSTMNKRAAKIYIEAKGWSLSKESISLKKIYALPHETVSSVPL